MKYTYKVTIERQTAPDNGESSLRFEFGSHDDVFKILERLQKLESVDVNTRSALIVGIKALGYAILSNKDSREMSRLLPRFKDLMNELKTGLTGDL